MAGMAIYVVVMNGWLSCNSANDGTPCGARERADARRADVKKDAAQRRDIVEPVKNRDIQGRTMQLRVLGCSNKKKQGLRAAARGGGGGGRGGAGGGGGGGARGGGARGRRI